MAPMPRTSRKDPSLNALDDLNLDDMFEGGNDGLFDDLGMDLNDLGDITADDKQKGAVPPVPKELDHMAFDLLVDIGVDDGVTSPPPEDEPLKKSRRKTKRKSKGTPPYDEDDYVEDDQPIKKKRRTKKTKGASRKGSKANAAAEPPDIPVPAATSKTSKAKAKASAAALERATSQGSMVAAAGQFGGRHKRGAFPSLARATSKTSKSKNSAPTSAPPIVQIAPANKLDPEVPQPGNAKRSRSIATDAPKPLETLYSGLKPSLYFYPFLPTIPPEPSMKKANKIYPSLDKIHTALSSTAPGPEVEDNLLKLLMFHDALPTKEKKLIMSASILNARKSIRDVDTKKLVADLTSAAMLIKRQHDFLAQSLDNMERWSKCNFSPDDYRAVYGGEKPKPVLSQLTSPHVRVRIKCSSYREPKQAAVLMACIVLPGSKLAQTKEGTTTTKKKRVSASGTTSMERAAMAAAPPAVAKPLEYSEKTPNARRQHIMELVTRNAAALELKQVEAEDTRRKAMEKLKLALDKVVEDDELLSLNTGTLWKWVEKSGIFADFNIDDIEGLTKHQQPEIGHKNLLLEDNSVKWKKKPIPDPLYDRLQSLLVEVDDDEADSDDEEDGDGDDDEISSASTTWQPSNGKDNQLVDMSDLSLEERAYIHLRASGLVDESCRPPPPSHGGDNDGEELNGATHEDGEFEFEELIRTMKSDLLRMDHLNNSRVAYLESSARSHLGMTGRAKRDDERGGQLVTKCNQLMKKQKENKKSARQQKGTKKDEDWVPW